MKLYLASYRIPVPEALFELLSVAPDKVKMALIPNAKDYYAPRARNFKIRMVSATFETLGFKPEVVDLNDYDQSSIASKLAAYDFVWVMGGNTFCLRYAMQQSGFDQVIKHLIDDGLVYGGDSAGAIIAGPSINGVEFADEPEFAEVKITAGLNVTPTIVVPHIGSQMYGQAIEKLLEVHSDKSHVVQLADNQAWVVNGDKAMIVTGTSLAS